MTSAVMGDCVPDAELPRSEVQDVSGLEKSEESDPHDRVRQL